MLMRVLAMHMRTDASVRVPIKLALIFKRTIHFYRRLLDRAVVVMMVIVQGWCDRLVMHLQTHAQSCVEFGMIGEFEKANLRSFSANKLLGFYERLFRKFVDFVQHDDIGILQLLIEDRIDGAQMFRDLRGFGARNRFPALKIAGKQMRGVNDREHRVEWKVASDFRPG